MSLANIREIKFRYVFYFPTSKVTKCFIRTIEQIEETKTFPLGRDTQIIAKNQYLNFDDVEGEELYESDVVQLDLPFREDKPGEPIIGEIKWFEGCFVIEAFETGVNWPLGTGNITKLGDIYHNKDLVDELPKKKENHAKV